MNGSKNYDIYTMEYYTAERKKELLPFATAWKELESIMLSKISQAVKDKYHMISPISGTQSTKQTNKQNKTRDIEIENNLTVTRGEMGRDNGGKGVRVLQLYRNNYKGHMDKTKGRGWKQGKEVGMDGVGRELWGVNTENCN